MSLHIGRQYFFRARLAALREELCARLMGRPVDLLPFEALQHALRGYERQRFPEPQSIPLERIVGSTGRSRDFTRQFRPRASVNTDRWARLDAAMADLEGVPPIEVFQIGSVYFVSDGNHRVSVARACGFVEIEAYVTRIVADVDLQPGDSLVEASRKAENAANHAAGRSISASDIAGSPDQAEEGRRTTVLTGLVTRVGRVRSRRATLSPHCVALHSLRSAVHSLWSRLSAGEKGVNE